jgi:hypothetical protein
MARLIVGIISCTYGLLSSYLVAQTNEVTLLNHQFSVEGQSVPNGCFAQLMTQLNGDNIVRSIFLTRPSLRGCIDANDPYPSGDENKVSVEVTEKDDSIYYVKVCERLDGSLGETCDHIIIQFETSNYLTSDNANHVLSVTKLGEWK